MISIRDLNKSYIMGKNKLHVLKGINLEIAEGEFVAIMGSSGSGKSTLLNIIGMLDEHDTGIYELDTVRIEKLNETKAANYRNKFLGFIFQSYNLIGFKNVLEFALCKILPHPFRLPYTYTYLGVCVNARIVTLTLT